MIETPPQPAPGLTPGDGAGPREIVERGGEAGDAGLGIALPEEADGAGRGRWCSRSCGLRRGRHGRRSGGCRSGGRDLDAQPAQL